MTRVPSTGVIRFLDYFSGLTAAEAGALLDAHARIHAMGFFPPMVMRDQILQFVNTDPAFLRYREAMLSAPFTMGLRYLDLRMLKAVLGDPTSVQMMAQTRATLDFTPRDDPPTALVSSLDPAQLKPSKAPQLRKLIEAAFKELFATAKKKLPGGETGYTGVLQGTNITVRIDFAARGLQLRYSVSIPDGSKRVFVSRRAYEDLWAAGQGWDYLTEENAEPSIRLLCELLVQMVELRNSVAALM